MTKRKYQEYVGYLPYPTIGSTLHGLIAKSEWKRYTVAMSPYMNNKGKDDFPWVFEKQRTESGLNPYVDLPGNYRYTRELERLITECGRCALVLTGSKYINRVYLEDFSDPRGGTQRAFGVLHAVLKCLGFNVSISTIHDETLFDIIAAGIKDYKIEVYPDFLHMVIAKMDNLYTVPLLLKPFVFWSLNLYGWNGKLIYELIKSSKWLSKDKKLIYLAFVRMNDDDQLIHYIRQHTSDVELRKSIYEEVIRHRKAYEKRLKKYTPVKISPNQTEELNENQRKLLVL